MAATGTPTPNIGLRIPLGTDPASVDDINYNSNLIDTKLGAVGNDSVQDQIDDLNSNIASKFGKLHNYSFLNKNNITITLPFEPSASYMANGIMYNANQQVLALLRIDNTPAVRVLSGSITYTISVSGNTVTITPNATLWGGTNILLDWNY